MATKDVESGPAIRELVKEKSVTMEYFLESSHLDNATADMLKKYDRDGNGSFSKDEVVAIILDLREAMQSNEMLGASNKMLRKIVVAVSFFSLIMLASIFGLTYGVVALTAKLDVDSTGVMTTTDGKTHVATDSTGYKITPAKNPETGAFCITPEEGSALYEQAISGKTNVIVEFDDVINDVNGTQTMVEQINGGVVKVDQDTGVICFTNANGREICMQKTDECLTAERRLQKENRRLARELSSDDEDDGCTQENLDDLDFLTKWLNAGCFAGCEDDLECKCDCVPDNLTINPGPT